MRVCRGGRRTISPLLSYLKAKNSAHDLRQPPKLKNQTKPPRANLHLFIQICSQYRNTPTFLSPSCQREVTSDVTVLERMASLQPVCLPSIACLLLHKVMEIPHAFSAEWGFPENDKATFPFQTIPMRHLLARCTVWNQDVPLRLGLQSRLLLEGGDLVGSFIGMVA